MLNLVSATALRSLNLNTHMFCLRQDLILLISARPRLKSVTIGHRLVSLVDTQVLTELAKLPLLAELSLATVVSLEMVAPILQVNSPFGSLVSLRLKMETQAANALLPYLGDQMKDLSLELCSTDDDHFVWPSHLQNLATLHITFANDYALTPRDLDAISSIASTRQLSLRGSHPSHLVSSSINS